MAAELQHTADLADRAEVLNVFFQFLNTKKQCDVERTFSLKVATEAVKLNSWFVRGLSTIHPYSSSALKSCFTTSTSCASGNWGLENTELN